MHLLEKLEQNRNLTLEEWQALIQKQSEYQKEAEKRANILREQNFGNRIYVRGLIEFTNYCKRLLLLWDTKKQSECRALSSEYRADFRMYGYRI